MKGYKEMSNQKLLISLMLIKELMLIDKDENKKLILDILEKLIKELRK